MFETRLTKGGVYLMSDFIIVQNLGSYRVTVHCYRLIFKDTTEVLYFGTILNPTRNVSLLDSSYVCDQQRDSDYSVGNHFINPSIGYRIESVILYKYLRILILLSFSRCCWIVDRSFQTQGI